MRRIYRKNRSFTFLPAFALLFVPGLATASEPFPRDEKADALEKARADFEASRHPYSGDDIDDMTAGLYVR